MGLLHRSRSNRGVYVENPQLNATVSHVAHIVRQPDGTVLGAGRLDPLQTGISPLDRLYETRDGWVCVVAISDAEIRRLESAIEVAIAGRTRALAAAIRTGLADHEDAASIEARIRAADAAGLPLTLW